MKLLRIKQVCDQTGLSRSTLYELMGRGDFPRSVLLTAHSVGWRSTDVSAWLESRPPTVCAEGSSNHGASDSNKIRCPSRRRAAHIA